jgi:hypothetical protein
VSSTAEGTADRGGVVRVTGAHAQLGDPGGALLEEQGDLHRVKALELIDDALGLHHVRTGLGEHRLSDLGPHQPPVQFGAQAAHGQPFELELPHRARLVALERHPSGVGARSDQVGAEAERLLGGVLMAEAARVREQRSVKVGGDVGGNGRAERGKEVVHHLAGGAGGHLDEVDRAEALVADVVVDVHHCRRPLDQVLPVAEAGRRRAVEGEQRVDIVWGALGNRREAGQVVEQAGHGRRHEHVHVPAHGAHGQRESKGGPQAVSVGILVGQARDDAGAVEDGADVVDDVLEARPGRDGGGHSAAPETGSASAAGGSRSRSMLLMCTL